MAEKHSEEEEVITAKEPSGGDEPFLINVVSQNTDDAPVLLQVRGTDKVADVVARLEDKAGIPRGNLRLLLSGKALSKDSTIEECRIDSKSVLSMFVIFRVKVGPATGFNFFLGDVIDPGQPISTLKVNFAFHSLKKFNEKGVGKEFRLQNLRFLCNRIVIEDHHSVEECNLDSESYVVFEEISTPAPEEPVPALELPPENGGFPLEYFQDVQDSVKEALDYVQGYDARSLKSLKAELAAVVKDEKHASRELNLLAESIDFLLRQMVRRISMTAYSAYSRVKELDLVCCFDKDECLERLLDSFSEYLHQFLVDFGVTARLSILYLNRLVADILRMLPEKSKKVSSSRKKKTSNFGKNKKTSDSVEDEERISLAGMKGYAERFVCTVSHVQEQLLTYLESYIDFVSYELRSEVETLFGSYLQTSEEKARISSELELQMRTDKSALFDILLKFNTNRLDLQDAVLGECTNLTQTLTDKHKALIIKIDDLSSIKDCFDSVCRRNSELEKKNPLEAQLLIGTLEERGLTLWKITKNCVEKGKDLEGKLEEVKVVVAEQHDDDPELSRAIEKAENSSTSLIATISRLYEYQKEYQKPNQKKRLWIRH